MALVRRREERETAGGWAPPRVSTRPGWVTGPRLCLQENVGCSPLQAPGPQKRSSPTAPHSLDPPYWWGLLGPGGLCGVGGHGRGWLHRGPPPVCGKPTQRGGGVGGPHPASSEPQQRPRVPGAWVLPLTRCVQGLSPDPSAWVGTHLRSQLVPQPHCQLRDPLPARHRCLTCPHCSSPPSLGCSGAHTIPSALPGGCGLGEEGGRGGGAGRQRAETEVPSPRAPRGTWEHTHGSRAVRQLDRGSPGHGPPEAVSCSDPTWHPDPSVLCQGEKGAGQSCPAWEAPLGSSGWGSPGGELAPRPSRGGEPSASLEKVSLVLLAVGTGSPASRSSVIRLECQWKNLPWPWGSWLGSLGCLGAQAGLGPPLPPLTWGWGLPPSAGQAPLLSHAW
ncbi:splicing factor, proline- and glutamine-rich-like [Lutra lutra]|uniref:splicing factor, proline- and glutamine-rich-like n=1 Tax=Lutra lutra TaxID=9657 RepID=UPI001FD0E876|nr:splicing factor, proline- and glutamine-rich-like [Lutra lutra]